jgi:hypothetical protein
MIEPNRQQSIPTITNSQGFTTPIPFTDASKEKLFIFTLNNQLNLLDYIKPLLS